MLSNPDSGSSGQHRDPLGFGLIVPEPFRRLLSVGNNSLLPNAIASGKLRTMCQVLRRRWKQMRRECPRDQWQLAVAASSHMSSPPEIDMRNAALRFPTRLQMRPLAKCIAREPIPRRRASTAVECTIAASIIRPLTARRTSWREIASGRRRTGRFRSTPSWQAVATRRRGRHRERSPPARTV